MKLKRVTIHDNEKYLRQISKEVDFNDKSFLDDIKALEEYCENNVVYALAPVQIGIPKRIIYLRNSTPDMSKNFDKNYNEKRVLINPVILERKGHTKFLERCESCLDYSGVVDRPFSITIEYYDVSGKKIKETVSGFEATVLSHEYDHLNGILHMDLTDEVLILTIEETKEYRIKHPYEVISKDCDFESVLNKRS